MHKQTKKLQTKEKPALYIYWLLSLTGVLYLDICSSSMLGVWYTALDQNACTSLLTVAQYPTLQNSTTFRTKLHLLQLGEGSVQIHTDLFKHIQMIKFTWPEQYYRIQMNTRDKINFINNTIQLTQPPMKSGSSKSECTTCPARYMIKASPTITFNTLTLAYNTWSVSVSYQPVYLYSLLDLHNYIHTTYITLQDTNTTLQKYLHCLLPQWLCISPLWGNSFTTRFDALHGKITPPPPHIVPSDTFSHSVRTNTSITFLAVNTNQILKLLTYNQAIRFNHKTAKITDFKSFLQNALKLELACYKGYYSTGRINL